ncbi:hypothetical protein BDQ12DRAFT_562821, partial [Crucibulum laeve]
IELEGTWVCARKLLAETTRCLGRQHVGHFAKECKAPSATCARCTVAHPTLECTFNNRDIAANSCFNCQATGHGAESCSCPIYTRTPWVCYHNSIAVKYVGFSSTDPKTWRLLETSVPWGMPPS